MGTAPDHGNLSNVVVIYKDNQKNSRSPSSYRPISLANSIYKVFACMIQQRLSHSIDYLLHPNQYGSGPNALSPPHFSSWGDSPRFSNAIPLPCISSFWTGHKPLTALATNTLRQPSADMVSPLYSSKGSCGTLPQCQVFSYRSHLRLFLISSLQRHQTRMPSLSLYYRCFSPDWSPLIFPILLGHFHSHTHLQMLNMPTTHFSSLGPMVLFAAFYIFSNI